MSRANKALVVLVVAALGLWGCAQGPANSAEKIKALEGKISDLEQDYQAAASARDAIKKKLATFEEEQAKKHQEFGHQKEDLLQQVAARTAERDAAQMQFEQFRKRLRNLLGQAEAAIAVPAPPAAASSASINLNRS
jgi:seryl-tRNA synthetase